MLSGTLRKIYFTVALMIPSSQSGTCRLANHGGLFLFYLKTAEFYSNYDDDVTNEIKSLVIECAFELCFIGLTISSSLH